MALPNQIAPRGSLLFDVVTAAGELCGRNARNVHWDAPAGENGVGDAGLSVDGNRMDGWLGAANESVVRARPMD